MQNVMGAHTKGHNYGSLGICFVGNFDYASPSETQYRMGAELVNALMELHDIPKGRVYGHHHFAGYKTCPGRMFEMGYFQSLLKG